MTRLVGLTALSLALASGAASTLGACSSSSNDSGDQSTADAGDPTADDAGDVVDADNGAPSTQYPAPHPAVPQVQTFGGPILSAPHVVPVFFPGDEYQTQLETYLTQLAANKDWASAISEYGVGPLTVGASIVMHDAPASKVTEDDVDALMKSVGAGTASFQAGSEPTSPPDGNTIYALFTRLRRSSKRRQVTTAAKRSAVITRTQPSMSVTPERRFNSRTRSFRAARPSTHRKVWQASTRSRQA